MGVLEEKFIEVCDAYLSEHEGYNIRGEQGVFSFAMVVWLGIHQRLKGNSLRESMSALVERAKGGGLGFLTARESRKLREGNVSANTGGLSRARVRLSAEFVRDLFYSATAQIFKKTTLQSERRQVYVLDGEVAAIARSESPCRTHNLSPH